MKSLIQGVAWLALALLAMFGAVLCAVAVPNEPLWVVPGVGCLATAAYGCASLYSLLFFPRWRRR